MTAAAVEAPLDLRATWQRVRLPVVLGGLLLGTAVVLAAIQNAAPQRPLDPRDASPVGSRALAQLVDNRGVQVMPVASTQGLPLDTSTTVFVPDPGSLTTTALQTIAESAADVVVIAPRARELAALQVAGSLSGGGSGTARPDCAFQPAAVAGGVRFDGLVYLPGAGVTGCYDQSGDAGLLAEPRGSARTIVFGSARTFSNAWLADGGDAALGLGLLAGKPHLVWLLPQSPTNSAADAQHKGVLDLLPNRLLWASLQLFIVVVLVALWRGRRLGAVVVEPLPVVVRAVETVEGRARLLRAARARGTAAQALRDATLARMRDLVELGADAPAAAVVAAVSRRTSQGGGAVDALLYGAEPSDDAALVRLAADLDELERSVRRS